MVTALAARVILGAWFVFSGGQLIFGSGLDRFTNDVAAYKLVSPPWDAVIAYSLPWVELIAGVCLMIGILRRGAILAITGLVMTFCIAIGWAWVHQMDITCGCHGGTEKIQYWSKAAEFVGYFLVLGFLGWAELQTSKQFAPQVEE